jgi:hypothetical protein
MPDIGSVQLTLVPLPGLFVLGTWVGAPFVLALALSSTVKSRLAAGPKAAPGAGELATNAMAAAGMQATMRDRAEARLAREGLKRDRIKDGVRVSRTLADTALTHEKRIPRAKNFKKIKNTAYNRVSTAGRAIIVAPFQEGEMGPRGLIRLIGQMPRCPLGRINPISPIPLDV